MTRLTWLLLLAPGLLQAQQTGPYTTVTTTRTGDTVTTAWGRGTIDSVRVVRPTPLPDSTPVPPVSSQRGIAFLASGALAAGQTAPFTGSVDGYTPSNIVARLAQARRAGGFRVVLNLTGGAHDNYKTGGKFDLTKWQSRLDAFNTPVIKSAVAAAIADGTILAFFVMDEPQQCGADPKAWGPCAAGGEPYLTKAVIDRLCGRVRTRFPTAVVGVVHDVRKMYPATNYAVCDLVSSQYRLSKGPIDTFLKDGAAFAARSRVALISSMNVLHGGQSSPVCDQYGDEAEGTTLCPMTPAQIQEWGAKMGKVSCAVVSWRYDKIFSNEPAIKAAFATLSSSLAKLPPKSCRRQA